MQAEPTALRLPARLHALAAMSALLERLDNRPREASPEQYCGVVKQLNTLLSEAEPGAALDALLAVAPGTAELYENMHYGHAGLCRAPLDKALDAELSAMAVLKRAARA